MALQLPFRRAERFPALQQAKQLAETQAQQLVAAVEQRLPRRRVSFWAQPLGRALIVVSVAGTALAALAAFLMRRGDDMAESNQELGFATSHSELYDAHRAAGDDVAQGVDTVHEAAKESFPASDAPVFVNGPDVPIVRHGERKEELPYQNS
jgi:hypothetical protein